jgi:cytochrome c oxidase cbb3-type subunit 2
MNSTQAPFLHQEKSSFSVIFAGVAAITAAYVYFLLYAGFAFVDLARSLVAPEHMQRVLAALGTGGVAGSVMAAHFFLPQRGRWYLMGGFAGGLVAALLTLLKPSEGFLIPVALLVGFSAAWTAVNLSLCLRPTLHFHRLGMWCGLGTGLAYALCNQPFIFEASVDTKIVTAAIAAGVGVLASFKMRGAPNRPSSLPDYEFRAATGWVIAFFVLVFMDTLVFYIIQNSLALKQLSWDTPLVLQGNAFVHLCAAFLAGLVVDQRWPGIATVTALLLLLASCVVLGLRIDNFPKARMLYIAAVSIYSTVLIYLPARGGRPRFTAVIFALSGWMASGLALSAAVGVEARRIPASVIVCALVVGLSGLFARYLWIKRAQEMESERLVLRKSD